MKRLTDELVKDIAARRARTSAPDMAVSWRMSSLLQTYNKPTAHSEELLRYFPVAVVANIEGYFRARLAALIDHGEPFLSNAIKAYPDVRLDISMAGAIAERKVTIGGLISHSFGISSFDGLVKAVTSISGRPAFLDELSRIQPRLIGGEKRKPLISDPKETWSRLGSVFETRHILCHELATELALEATEIRALLLVAQEFTGAAAIWLDDVQNPNPEKAFRERSAKLKARHGKARASLLQLMSDAKASTEKLPDAGRTHRLLVQAEKATESLISLIGKLSSAVEPRGPSAYQEYRFDLTQVSLLEGIIAGLRGPIMDIGLYENLMPAEYSAQAKMAKRSNKAKV